jgi:hypothetical protein
LSVGDGTIAADMPGGVVGFRCADAFTPIPGPSADGVDVLPGGAVVFVLDGGGRLSGTGSGPRRIWVQLS